MEHISVTLCMGSQKLSFEGPEKTNSRENRAEGIMHSKDDCMHRYKEMKYSKKVTT